MSRPVENIRKVCMSKPLKISSLWYLVSMGSYLEFYALYINF